MARSIQRIYAAATPASIERCRRATIAYERLAPPDVAGEMLMLCGKIAGLPDFERWARAAPSLIEPASLPDRCPGDSGIPYSAAPERDRLLEAKWAAEQLGVPVAFYSAAVSGDRFEHELAWEFGQRERVLARGTRVVAAEQTGSRLWFFRQESAIRTVWENLLFEITAVDCLCRAGAASVGGVLRYLLPSFGIEARSGHFGPHAPERTP